MIDHQEAWQVFSEDGSAIVGSSILPTDSRRTNAVIVGAVHVWMWRRVGDKREVLLQKRAATKPTWPSHLDISVAGHVDVGESLFEAVAREAQEEVGYTVATDALVYVFGYRNFMNGLKWVYLYELPQTVEFSFNDGEVEELRWMDIDNFSEIVKQPEAHNLVPHPAEYFSLLLRAFDVV